MTPNANPRQTIPLAGYASGFSVSPGETIEFKVSSTVESNYHARLVRVVSCDPNPDGPGIVEHEIPASFEGDYPGRFQPTSMGSYVRVGLRGRLDGLGSFTALATIWPTLPNRNLQGVIGRMDAANGAGFALAVSAEGATACLGAHRLSVGKALIERRWYRVWMSFDARTGELTVGQAPVRNAVDADDRGMATASAVPSVATGDLLIGALGGDEAGQVDSAHFNGKIESPAIVGQVLNASEVEAAAADPDLGSGEATVAAWDFSHGISTRVVQDRGPFALHGEAVNLPARAVTDSNWDGSVHCWQGQPEHYGAIHFHDDDLYDCGWESDFSFSVPEGFRSGVYAARLESAAGDREMIPFFVTAPIGAPQSRIAVLVPTFTYTVYANISRGNNDEALRATVAQWNAWPWNADDQQEFGLSTYNLHHDGSGIAYSSRRRPIITMRSATVCYPNVPGSGLRHFAADAHLWYWLEAMGYEFDVVTDDDLHRYGVAAIEGYAVVMTTSHPEYHTRESLDALQGFTREGGHFMYLGGNGFYWKVAVSDEWPDAVEIRRAEGGIRAWAAEPGEYYNAFDGTLGGLWRRNGRPPQQLAGVGFTSQGEHRADGYRRTEASYLPQWAWMFDGIDGEVIGDFGLSGGGAAGFELDRADKRLGTPHNAVVVATSRGQHGDHFVLVPEDILTNLVSWNGEPFDDLIRSDIVYFETPNNGAVFSVGSITFCGCLPVNDCQNNVSRLVQNVLDRFLNRQD